MPINLHEKTFVQPQEMYKFRLTMKSKYSFDIQNGKNKNLIYIIDMPFGRKGPLYPVQVQKPWL